MPGCVMTAKTPAATARRRRHEERALFTRRERDGAARDALVERFLPLARRLARAYDGGDEREDLDQVAAIGLLKAIDRFDPSRGLAFSSSAVPTIAGELKRHLRDRAWSVRVPRAIQDLTLRLERVSVDLAGELGRAPTAAELAARADATIEQVSEALQAARARRAASLDEPSHNDLGGDPVGWEIGVEDFGFAAVEDAEQVEQLMQVLTPRERLVLEMRFGQDHYQWQIAERLGVTQMQVSRLIRNAIAQLRRAASARRRDEREVLARNAPRLGRGRRLAERLRACATCSGLWPRSLGSAGKEEELDLEIGADAVARDELQDGSSGEPLDNGDETVPHGVLERAPVVLDHRRALELDEGLLHVRVDAAEHAGEQVVAHPARLGADGRAVVVALV
jgi:RNA polymerase sigma-B factor